MNNPIDVNIDYDALGMRVREVRKRKGITQEKLAEVTGISQNFIARIESNNGRASLLTLVKIAAALDIGTDYLLSDTLKLSDENFFNSNSLNKTEVKFISSVIKGLKECEAELIYSMKDLPQ